MKFLHKARWWAVKCTPKCYLLWIASGCKLEQIQNYVQTKQNKTKQNKTKQTNKQTNKNKTKRKEKLFQPPISVDFKVYFMFVFEGVEMLAHF